MTQTEIQQTIYYLYDYYRKNISFGSGYAQPDIEMITDTVTGPSLDNLPLAIRVRSNRLTLWII